MEKVKKNHYGFEILQNELGSGYGRYYKRCQIAGVMKECGLSLSEANDLFNEYDGFGGKFTPKTLDRLY